MNRTTIFLAGLLLLQLGLLAVRGRGAGDAASRAEAKAPLFPGLTVEQIARVRIADRAGQSVELARGDAGGWVVASAGRYPAKADAVERLLGKVVALESAGTAATNAASHAGFEVAEELFQRDLRLFDGAGKEAWRLFLGRPVAGGVFARKGGDATVHRIAEPLAWQAATQPLPFIDTQLVKLDPTKAKALSFARGGKPALALERGEGGAWKATAPEPFDAEKAKVDETLRALSHVYAAAPVAAVAAAEHGLDGPEALTVEATLDDGTKVGISFGAASPTAGRRFARALGGAVAEVADAQAKALEKDEAFFRPAPPPAPPPGAPAPGSKPDGGPGPQAPGSR